ncbi:hypothetical protein DXB06_02065 [Butyricicoccus sp. OF13-6]|nr:hypothetical protein DXB06_02065 [Butyricicoccus sp. OF13-6]
MRRDYRAGVRGLRGCDRTGHPQRKPQCRQHFVGGGTGIKEKSMNQQQYRLLCMDIDGTLLNSAHKLPPANREAVQSAAKNGVTICLMSARPPRAVFPIRDALGVDGRWCAAAEDLFSRAKAGWRTAG